jgi:DNA-binding MarR family transcriptional regulator
MREEYMSLPDKVFLQINQALFSLAHAYETRMGREDPRNPLGLRLSDCSVLMVMGQFERINARRLSELMDINPGTISVYVQRLVELGLMQKHQDGEDRRNWWLELTGPGRMAAQGVIAGAVEYTRGFIASLSEEEQQTLHALLVKASHSLGFDWL